MIKISTIKDQLTLCSCLNAIVWFASFEFPLNYASIVLFNGTITITTMLQTLTRQLMKLNALLLFSLLTGLTSCNGQKTTQTTPKLLSNQNYIIEIGDTVSELDKSILIIFQARNNDYWFGSDGQGVYLLSAHPGDSPTRRKSILHFSIKDGMSGNRIREIQEDKSGNIFITTLEGIDKFDGQKFTTLAVADNTTYNNEWKLQPDDLWFKWFKGMTGNNGPYRFDGKTLYALKFPKHYLEDEYYKISPNRPWSPYDIYSTYKDSKGNIWFGTSNLGLCRFDGKSLSWLYEEHLTLIEGGGSFGIRSIFEDKEGKFWFCNTKYRYNIFPTSSTEQGKTLINYKREKGIDHLKAPDGKDMIYFLSMIGDNKGDLWMVTFDKGVWRYDNKNITHYPVIDEDKRITLFSIYKDRQGDLWLGTHQAGPYKFNGKTFEKFRP